MPAAASASTSGWHEPSRPGISEPLTQTSQLSMRQAIQGGEDVLDHFDLRAVGGQRGAAGDFDPLPDVGRRSAAADPGRCGRRRCRCPAGPAGTRPHVPAAPVSKARHRARAGERPLVSQGCRGGRSGWRDGLARRIQQREDVLGDVQALLKHDRAIHALQDAGAYRPA